MNFLFNINVCRVCMQNDQSNDLWNDKDLLEKFLFTTRLAVLENDNLPKVMCANCTVRLKVAYTFIKTAHESENNLKIFLAKISTEFNKVTQGNKSGNKTLNEHKLTDDILSFVKDEDQEYITNLKVIGENESITRNLTEKQISPTPDHAGFKFKTDFQCENSKQRNEAIRSKDVLNEESRISKQVETVYHLTDDILLIHADNNEIENDTNFMEVQTQDDDTELEHFEVGEDERVEEENEDGEELQDTQSEINNLGVIEESQTQSQFNKLNLNDSEENHNETQQVDNDCYLHEYESMIEDQVDSLQYQSDYVDETSIEEVLDKEDSFCVHNIDENDHDDDGKQHESVIKSITINKHGTFFLKPLVRKESRINRFYCEKCNRDFSTKTNLNRHLQLHEGIKPFHCTECKKSFTQKATLKQHMYTHTGERPYVCEVCNRGFTQCKSLIFHMRRHTGEKPFQCEYCFITFRQKDALRIHILKHHVIIEQTSDGNEMYACIICQRKFDTKLKFKTHMKAHTASAEIENVEFIHDQESLPLRRTKKQNSNPVLQISPDSESLEAAVVNVSASSAAEPSRAKKFQCRKCFKCFALKKSLLRHLRIHSLNTDDELTECLDCDLQFSTKADYQEHLMEQHQYACLGCPDMTFKSIQDLKMHMFEHELDQQEQL